MASYAQNASSISPLDLSRRWNAKTINSVYFIVKLIIRKFEDENRANKWSAIATELNM
jgi:hypothetical protein